MKRKLFALSRRYLAALRKFLQPGAAARPSPASRLGAETVALGLETLDLARIHEIALATLVLPGCSPALRSRMARQAEIFFAEANLAIEATHYAGLESESPARLHPQHETIRQRTAQLVSTNRHLKQGILRRKTTEVALRKSGQHNVKLLREADQLQKHLRDLIHQLLSAQEAQRKKISRELQDEVAQTLLGINVRLLTLKKAATGGTSALTKEIASTQRVVEESIHSIKRLAHELNLHQPA